VTRGVGGGVLKALFWDNDGVLVDTEELYFEATRTVLARAGYELTTEQYIDIGLHQGRSVFDLIRDRYDPEAIEDLRSVRNDLYAERLSAGIPALDGIQAVLAGLHRRVRMGVVTSCNPDHFKLIHRSTGLLQYFDFVLTSHDYEHTKPHPAPYLAALARSGFAPDECIAIEDSPRGLLAAHAAGLRCVVIPRGLTIGGDFTGAYRVASDTRELSDILAPLIEE